MKRYFHIYLLPIVASLMFFTSCDKISLEIHGSPAILCYFVNESGESILPERMEDLLVYGTILHNSYTIKTIVNGVELKGTEIIYCPKDDYLEPCLSFRPEQVNKYFTPKDKKLNIEFLIKFPALFLDEDTHSIKYSVELLQNGNIEHTKYLYFDRENIYQWSTGYMNVWSIKIK